MYYSHQTNDRRDALVLDVVYTNLIVAGWHIDKLNPVFARKPYDSQGWQSPELVVSSVAAHQRMYHPVPPTILNQKTFPLESLLSGDQTSVLSVLCLYPVLPLNSYLIPIPLILLQISYSYYILSIYYQYYLLVYLVIPLPIHLPRARHNIQHNEYPVQQVTTQFSIPPTTVNDWWRQMDVY